MFNDTYKEPTEVIFGETYQRVQLEHHILKQRRLEFSLTQQQVADKAGIQLRQYTRIESGERSLQSTSFRVVMSICNALALDPHRFI